MGDFWDKFLEFIQNVPPWVWAIVIGAVVIIVLLIVASIISKTSKQKFIKVFGNLLWMILVGWVLAIIYGLIGIVCFVTILFIPVGLQYFKLAKLAFWPFGYKPVFTKLNGFKMFVNIVWMILAGWEQAVLLFIVGGVMCVTIVFIPCGLQLFKFGRLVLMPLGTTIEKIKE